MLTHMPLHFACSERHGAVRGNHRHLYRAGGAEGRAGSQAGWQYSQLLGPSRAQPAACDG